MDHPRLTRAEIATHTGLSKPTASESARRLTEVGLLRDTGERTTGRGRVGSYYALAADLGTALAVDIAPTAVVVEAVDVYGHTVSGPSGRSPDPPHPADVAERCAAGARDAATGRVHLAVVSAADPVDRGTGRLVHLPDAPFLVGELSPADILAPLVDGPVETDNDVNWAARAEQSAAVPGALADFAYLYLGEGLGCALVSDGEVRRGHHGLSGKSPTSSPPAPTAGPCRFTQVFAELGLRHPGHTAIDDAVCCASSTTRPPPAKGSPAPSPGSSRRCRTGRSRGHHPRRQLGHPSPPPASDRHPPRPSASLGSAAACRRPRPARPHRRPPTRDPPPARHDHRPQPHRFLDPWRRPLLIAGSLSIPVGV